eukprot:g41731.t1
MISVSSGETKLPTGTESLIATESDIDLTAQLVPSGGFQSHSCVTTHPISETGPQAECKFKYTFSCSPCIYTETVPVHSIQSSDYRIHHTPTGHDSSKTQYEETPSRGTSFVKTLASSTVPFSLGTSPNPGLVKGNLSAGNVQGSGGQLTGVRPDNTMDGGDRALVQVPISETDSNQNENFTKEPEKAGIFSQAPKYEDWLVGENEEELYCEAGLVLSNQEGENLVDRVIVTMQDGARLALRPAKHGSISYYWPCVDFYVVQQLGSNWFRVKDRTTRQLVMMKKNSDITRSD